MDCLIKGHQKV